MPDPKNKQRASPSQQEDSAVHSDAHQALVEVAYQHTLALPLTTRIREASEAELASTERARLIPNEHDTDAHSITGLCDPSVVAHFQDTYDTSLPRARELGRGGIGRVFIAFDRTLGRDVAMKELLPELIGDNRVDATTDHPLALRFLREARVTGQLEHPNIVPVYELGREPNGRLYYTMRVVRGRTLTSAINDASSLSGRLSLVNHFAGLCQAIAYAHSRGVLHRDIKPDNVMIGEFGETFVLDWGLAKILEDTSPRSLRAAASLSPKASPQQSTTRLTSGVNNEYLTQTGSIVGTPLFMSPEQILQSPDAAKPTCDVWSLGVVLYYILTGNLPFAGATLNQLVSAVLAAAPVDIRRICPDAPPDLAAIAQRALAKNPAHRYPSARELAKDIAAYQAGEKVAAYDYGSIELLRRFVQRNRAAVLIATTASLALFALLLGSYLRISSARDQALVAEKRATLGEHQAKLNLSDVLVERARASAAEGDSITSTLLAVGALELAERPDARGLVVAQENAERLAPMPIPTFSRPCVYASWNATERELACRSTEQIWLARLDQSIRTIDLKDLSNSPIVSLNAEGWMQHLSRGGAAHIDSNGSSVTWNFAPDASGPITASPDGVAIAQGNSQGHLQVWKTNPPQVLVDYDFGQAITALAIHPVEPLIAIGTYRGEIFLFNYRKDKEPYSLGQSRSTVLALAFSPKGGTLASGGADRMVLLWDTRIKQLSAIPLRAASAVTDVAWSKDGALLAVASKSTGIDLIDAQRQERVMRMAQQHAGVRDLAFTNSDEIVGVTEDNHPFRLEVRKSSPPARFASSGNVLSLAWSKDADRVLLGGLGDRGICYLLVPSGTCVDRLPVRISLVRRIAVSTNGKRLAIAGTGGSVELWDAIARVPIGYVPLSIAEVRDALFLAGGTKLLVAGASTTMVMIDLAKMAIERRYPVPAPVQSMVTVGKGEEVVLGLRNGEVAVWSTTEARIKRSVPLNKGWVMGVIASSARDWLAATTADGTISFLSYSHLRLEQTLRVHPGRPTAIAYSEKLGLIATGGEDRKVQLVFPNKPWRILATLDEHQGTVRSLLFDESHNNLMSGGDDGMVRLWSLKQLTTPPYQLRQAIESLYNVSLDAGRIVPRQPRTAPPGADTKSSNLPQLP